MENSSHTSEARILCEDAQGNGGGDLQQRTDNLEEALQQMQSGSILPLGLFERAKDFREEISIATNMDGLISNYSSTVIAMVDSVSSGYRERLQDIITDGIPDDILEAGSSDADPAPADVESDIREIEEPSAAIDGADMFTAIVASRAGLGGTSDKLNSPEVFWRRWSNSRGAVGRQSNPSWELGIWRLPRIRSWQCAVWRDWER